jgi:hypothetical protein
MAPTFCLTFVYTWLHPRAYFKPLLTEFSSEEAARSARDAILRGTVPAFRVFDVALLRCEDEITADGHSVKRIDRLDEPDAVPCFRAPLEAHIADLKRPPFQH